MREQLSRAAGCARPNTLVPLHERFPDGGPERPAYPRTVKRQAIAQPALRLAALAVRRLKCRRAEWQTARESKPVCIRRRRTQRKRAWATHKRGRRLSCSLRDPHTVARCRGRFGFVDRVCKTERVRAARDRAQRATRRVARERRWQHFSEMRSNYTMPASYAMVRRPSLTTISSSRHPAAQYNEHNPARPRRFRRRLKDRENTEP